MRTWLQSFAGDTRGWLRELAGDRNWLGLGLVLIFLPVITIADLVVHLVDVGPE